VTEVQNKLQRSCYL